MSSSSEHVLIMQQNWDILLAALVIYYKELLVS
jgi:hypothetical protein